MSRSFGGLFARARCLDGALQDRGDVLLPDQVVVDGRHRYFFFGFATLAALLVADAALVFAVFVADFVARPTT